jgi:DNA polymerase-1
MEPLVIDIESTTFDDKIPKEKQFNPFLGPRIAGFGISTLDSKKQWYLPMRHRGVDVLEEVAKNCPLEPAQAFLKDVLGSGRDIVNHNIQFDALFWHLDGAEVMGELVCTLALARVVNNLNRSNSLNSLTGGEKGDAVKAYTKSLKTKDWGRVPIDLMARYCGQDVRITAQLYHKLMSQLREEAKHVWAVERRLTKHLVEATIHGIRVDVSRLKATHATCLRELIALEEKAWELAGCEFDPNSSKDITQLMLGRLGIEPKTYTKKGSPQWTNVSLMECGHPVGPVIAKYHHFSHFTSTYCEGWMRRMDENGRLHAKFNQGGTKTGRLSSSDPNLQNVPVEAEAFVLPDEGCAILGYDYSQIEYRLFGHYANDEVILERYRNDPGTDFHQSLADMMGVDRQFAKSCNFAFLYGMGKPKLLEMIAAIASVKDNPDMEEKMRALLTGAAHKSAEKIGALDIEDYKLVASEIYDRYHREFPAIRKLRRRITDACNARGWLRNYCGRIYKMPYEFVYRCVNYLIQGGAADIFKQRLLALLDAARGTGAKLITNVHDSVFFSVPHDELPHFMDLCQTILPAVEAPPFSPKMRVPLLVDGKVSDSHWGAVIKCNTPDELGPALVESRKGATRGWGTIEGASEERSTGHGQQPDFSAVSSDAAEK